MVHTNEFWRMSDNLIISLKVEEHAQHFAFIILSIFINFIKSEYSKRLFSAVIIILEKLSIFVPRFEKKNPTFYHQVANKPHFSTFHSFSQQYNIKLSVQCIRVYYLPIGYSRNANQVK